MKFCDPHWVTLRTAIEIRGLMRLVAKEGATAAENIHAELQGEDYDPLMNAYWMLTNQALKMGGLYLMHVDEQGIHYCPLCEVDKNGGNAEEWISGCTDSILKHCRENGLTTPQQ